MTKDINYNAMLYQWFETEKPFYDYMSECIVNLINQGHNIGIIYKGFKNEIDKAKKKYENEYSRWVKKRYDYINLFRNNKVKHSEQELSEKSADELNQECIKNIENEIENCKKENFILNNRSLIDKNTKAIEGTSISVIEGTSISFNIILQFEKILKKIYDELRDRKPVKTTPELKSKNKFSSKSEFIKIIHHRLSNRMLKTEKSNFTKLLNGSNFTEINKIEWINTLGTLKYFFDILLGEQFLKYFEYKYTAKIDLIINCFLFKGEPITRRKYNNIHPSPHDKEKIDRIFEAQADYEIKQAKKLK